MKVNIISKGNNEICFSIESINDVIANTLRRIMLVELPAMAVKTVEFSKNNSGLYDEILAHRIGLIPLKTDRASKELKYKLKVEGPKMVYSTDIKPEVGTGMKLPIVILDKGQEIEIVLNAVQGKGIEHIKYSPGLMFYKHDIDDDVLDFLHVSGDGEVSYDEDEMKDKKLSEGQINKIKAVKEAKELSIKIESWGQIDVKDIFIKAIEVLEDNLKNLSKAVK
jgi:DNA-directed RNA polymerase alpha subunit